VGTACLKYFITAGQAPQCNGHLGTAAAPKATKASIPAGTGVEMARTLAVINGATPAQAVAKYPGPTHAGEASQSNVSAGGPAAAQPVGGSTSGTTYYSPLSEGSEADGMLLNYLLGN
jgi:hypothetical protein